MSIIDLGHTQVNTRIDGEEGLHMSNGDLVVIPHGAGHLLADSPTTPARPSAPGTTNRIF